MGSDAEVKLLLDTHIWLWSLLQPDALSPRVAEVLEHEATELWLSPISIWEVLMSIERGRVEVDDQPSSWVRRAIAAVPMKEASLNAEVAFESRSLRVSHADPADRFLVATAKVYELTLVTADREVLKVKEVPLLPNR